MKMGWEAFCFPTWKNIHNWGEIKQRFFSIKYENLLLVHTELKMKMKTFNRQLKIKLREQGDQVFSS